MPWPFVAVSVLLFGLTGLFALAVASYCRKLADSSQPDIPAGRLRSMAAGLGVVLVLLGMSCLWAAFLFMDWTPRG
jgi:hypothetical protein